jgi:hypothetical protein
VQEPLPGIGKVFAETYGVCWRRVISVIQIGANGDVRFGGVG